MGIVGGSTSRAVGRFKADVASALALEREKELGVAWPRRATATARKRGPGSSPAEPRRGVVYATAAVALALFFPSGAMAAAPVVKATWATEVTASSVRVRGLLDTGNEHTTYRFDYLTVAAYEANQKAGSEGFQGALHIPVGPEAKPVPRDRRP